MSKLYTVSIALLILCSCTRHEEFRESTAKWNADRLTVSTGKVERIWSITSYGLVTEEINNLQTGKQWSKGNSEAICDWDYLNLISKDTKGRLVSIEAHSSDDSCFTSEHLCVTVEYTYPELDLDVKYQIRAYPEAEGLYTAVSLKGNPSAHIKDMPVRPGISFGLVSGENIHDYKANATVAQHFAGYTWSDSKVEYLISGLDENRNYMLGLSCWAYLNDGMFQNIRLSSIDNEMEVTLAGNYSIPSVSGNGKPAELLFTIPGGLAIGGTARLTLEKVKGEARVSEIWIYEKDSDTDLISNADPERLDDLRHKSPEGGYRLAGYINCGTAIQENDTPASTGRVDFFPVDASDMARIYAGYYNDTQHRNMKDTPLLKEDLKKEGFDSIEVNSWASLMAIQDGDDALWIVKESHKCVNQPGIDTGEFISDKNGIANTGTSLRPDEILPDRFRQAWGTWMILCDGDRVSQELALKRFERVRYPVNHDTDVYTISNVWGSGRGANAAYEENVLLEIEGKKELGIDVQQIDDGYFYPGTKRPVPEESIYRAHASKYPSGFRNVRTKALENGISLGLWFPAMPVSLEDMIANYDEGGFKYYKLDFTDFRTYQDMEDMIRKIRAFEKYTGHTAKVNWDVTENATRFGYFWAKEYGCVFLENRRHDRPVNVIYEPYLVLRDMWHLSRYCNLNKFQGTIQNKDMVDPSVSDAGRYSHGYTVAIALMSTPLFFQETHFLSEKATDEIKEVLDAYKKVRHPLYDCFVFPVGDEPDNRSWSGLQAHHPEERTGYLNLFREIENHNSRQTICLNFLSGKEVIFTDLISGTCTICQADEYGNIEFNIPEPGGFRMYSYRY